MYIRISRNNEQNRNSSFFENKKKEVLLKQVNSEWCIGHIL